MKSSLTGLGLTIAIGTGGVNGAAFVSPTSNNRLNSSESPTSIAPSTSSPTMRAKTFSALHSATMNDFDDAADVPGLEKKLQLNDSTFSFNRLTGDRVVWNKESHQIISEDIADKISQLITTVSMTDFAFLPEKFQEKGAIALPDDDVNTMQVQYNFGDDGEKSYHFKWQEDGQDCGFEVKLSDINFYKFENFFDQKPMLSASSMTENNLLDAGIIPKASAFE